MKYRKKPVVIEAMQYKGVENLAECMAFIDRSGRPAKWNAEEGLKIETLEGIRVCSIGDFIIEVVQGEMYPCEPDIFKAIYEMVKGNEDD